MKDIKCKCMKPISPNHSNYKLYRNILHAFHYLIICLVKYKYHVQCMANWNKQLRKRFIQLLYSWWIQKKNDGWGGTAFCVSLSINHQRYQIIYFEMCIWFIYFMSNWNFMHKTNKVKENHTSSKNNTLLMKLLYIDSIQT